MRRIARIVWVSSTLNEAGGGARLLLEGVEYYRSIGIDVHVITWDFDEDALFDGRYSKHNISELDGGKNDGAVLSRRALKRLSSVFQLRQKVVSLNPDIVFVQSEYDATLLRMALMFSGIRFATFVFGQMFQFPNDLAKYSFPFNRHLEEIRLSTPGYREFVPARRPTSRWQDIILAQIIAGPRYFALRASVAVFTFSKQVKWEVSKIYGVEAEILKGAFPRKILERPFKPELSKYPVEAGRKMLLSLSRLIEKKRVALKIQALNILVNQNGRKDLHLLIGGKGSELTRLTKMVEEFNLSDHVSFIGYVPEPDVLLLTAACDVYLSLDVADFDISPFEALAMKRKIVWSSEMDMDEYLKSCGAVFPAEPTPEGVARTILVALDKSENTIDWSQRGNYSWETYFNKILLIIESRL